MSKIVLFQGDSITDCGRSREDNNALGHGYASMAGGRVLYENAGEYTVYNKGISGNRIVDLYARIKSDVINLKPDYMSILIGVNDVWHEINWNNGVETAKFEKIYDMFIEEVKTELPNIKIVILEPYVVEGRATMNDEEHPDRYERFRSGVDEKRAVAKKLAEKYNLKFIPLAQLFDEAEAKVKGIWTTDGVHPTPAGHALIADAWMKVFNELK